MNVKSPGRPGLEFLAFDDSANGVRLRLVAFCDETWFDSDVTHIETTTSTKSLLNYVVIVDGHVFLRVAALFLSPSVS